MSKAHMIFTKLQNSFRVQIPNLEQLSVSEIQNIETFVSIRNGIFDFVTYSFEIQKNLEYDAFVLLLKHIDIDVKCEEHILIDKFIPRISFGQYKGMYFSDLPDTYLLWLKGNYRGYQRDLLDDELTSRSL